MIDPDVRPAASSDADQLVELEVSAREALVGQRGGDRWLRDHPSRGSRWSEAIDRDHVFVGRIDRVIVGYLVLSVDGWLATVEEVFVDVAARELGFGDELLASAIGRARELGAMTVDATALPGDRETKNLYERAGIKARSITVSVDL